MADLSHSTSAAVENCANEPIHIPGGIQPHGFLFSIAADGTVLQASSNATQLNVCGPSATPLNSGDGACDMWWERGSA